MLGADDYGRRMRVLAYASPPILDYDSAKACALFTTTIVNNSDIIPRASLSNLAVYMEILEGVNKKLTEKGLVDAQSRKGTSALIRKLAEGTKGELLMEADELFEISDIANAKVEVKDPDHLYVPGRVLVMYDRWNSTTQTKEEEKKDDSSVVDSKKTAEGFIISEDGATNVLRTIEMHERMITDRLAEGYRSSIKSLMTA